MELNNDRSKTSIVTNRAKKSDCGFVYIISNPAFQGAVKVGITKNVISRLSTYQTYDPNRAYKIEHYEFCENVREKEKILIDKFSIDLYKGEWIPDNRREILKVLFDNFG